jgi:hypothetical protein
MNKFTIALALGAGLALNLATPAVQASTLTTTPTVQDLQPTAMSATQFKSDFTPISGVAALNNPFSFLNSSGTGSISPAGTVESQVFQGQGAAAGLYAYTYQIDVNNVNDSTGQPIGVNSTAMYFNATPTLPPTSLVAGSAPSSVYLVNAAIGGLNAPTTTGGSVVGPSQILWQPGTTTGSLTFQYLNSSSNTGPLMAGTDSGTIVVLSTQAPASSQLLVSLQSPDPQNGYPQVYTPQAGSINPVPAPEPATLIGWVGIIGAAAIAHRIRRNRRAA